MKRIIKVTMILLICFVFSGCKSKYNAITYTKFNETFKNKTDYITNNLTIKYEDRFERCLEAAGKNNQFLFYEFKTEEEAKKYILDNYKNRKKYKIRKSDNHIIVECKDGMYFYAVQADKMVLVGDSPVKQNKKEIRKIFSELGY